MNNENKKEISDKLFEFNQCEYCIKNNECEYKEKFMELSRNNSQIYSGMISVPNIGSSTEVLLALLNKTPWFNTKTTCDYYIYNNKKDN